MTIEVHRYDDPGRFLERARDHLMAREVENNLLLDLAGRLGEGARPPRTGEPYLAVVEDGGRVIGCALRTPPWKLVISPMPDRAARALADDVAVVYDSLPAVLGPHDTAGSFARRWEERTGQKAREGDRQRVWVLEELEPPPSPPAGRLRRAEPSDLPVVATWTGGFRSDTGLLAPEAAVDEARRRTAAGELYVWEGGADLRSMGAVVGRSATVTRIGLVYTPPPERGKGYASALVAALSRVVLDGGARSCSLYTQRANRVSNAIYARLGYRPVADHTDWHLGAGPPSPGGPAEPPRPPSG